MELNLRLKAVNLNSVERESKNDLSWYLLQSKVFELKLVDLFEGFREHNVEPFIFKGWSVAAFYPQNKCRSYVDIDLSVNSADFELAKQLLSNQTPPFTDLHLELRHLDSTPWYNLFDNCRFIKINNTKIRVLRPEDHLRVICVHWLTDGGEFRERLWDVYYMVKNRPADFDWDRCLNIVSKRRRRWIVCTIGLAHKYLGLDISDTPIAEEAKDLPKWLVKRIEKEWKSDIRLIPLSAARHNFKTFIQQVWKRFPPNPITATIDCEGDFDAGTRIFYQIRDMFKRLKFRKTHI